MQNNYKTEDHDLTIDSPHVKRMSINNSLECGVYEIPAGNSAITSMVPDDSVIAVERAMMNLDLDDAQESRDSKVEWEEEIEPHTMVIATVSERTALSEERMSVNSLTRGRVEHLYLPPAPSEEHIYDVPNDNQLSQISELSTSSTISSVMPITLTAIVSNAGLFVMFWRYLKDRSIEQNLNFWLACEHYRQLSTDNREHLLTVAKTIYLMFIKNSAPQKVTIHTDTKNRITMILGYKSDPLTVQLFDTAQQEIWEVMERNEVSQFAVSASFVDCHQSAYLLWASSNHVADIKQLGEDTVSLCSYLTDTEGSWVRIL